MRHYVCSMAASSAAPSVAPHACSTITFRTPQLLVKPNAGLSIYLAAGLLQVVARVSDLLQDEILRAFQQVGGWVVTGAHMAPPPRASGWSRAGKARPAVHLYMQRHALQLTRNAPGQQPTRTSCPAPLAQQNHQVVSGLLQRLTSLAASDDDWLSDQGQDRTYSTLRMLLHAAGVILAAHGRPVDADAALAPLQQAFVVRMMESAVFTKQLSGVRELKFALHRVVGLPDSEQHADRVLVGSSGACGRPWPPCKRCPALAPTVGACGIISTTLKPPRPLPPLLQAFVEWMEEHHLVERMLRANLHQRQYMQQVCAGCL